MPSNSEEVESLLIALSPENDPGACGLCLKLFTRRERDTVLLKTIPDIGKAGELIRTHGEDGHYFNVNEWDPKWGGRLAFGHIRCWKRKEKREGRGKKT